MCAAALAAVVLVYSNHWGNGFHFDDFHAVVNNPAIGDLGSLPRFFTDPATSSVLPANRVWRPVVEASLAVDFRVGGGLRPWAFHASTFGWYLVQLGLMWMLFRTLLGNDYAALFAATWYGVHPAMAETVNYICQRGDVYSTLAVVAGLVLYIRKPEWRRYGAYLIPVVLGMLAKPPAFVFAPILLAYVGLKRWRATIPSFVVCGAMLGLHARMTPRSFVPGNVPAYDYIITQPYVALRYFRSFFLPLWLTADTDLAPFTSAATPAAMAGFAFVAALAWAIWGAARRQATRPIAFGLLWFLLALLPTALFPLSEVENDHRMFMPFVGLVLAVTSAAMPFWNRRFAAVAVLLLAAYAQGTWKRNQVWHTEESLWRDVTLKSPGNGRGLMNYAVVLMGQGRMAEARTFLEKAIAYTPNYSLLEINLGVVTGAQGNAQEAERHFRRAVALAPADPGSYFFYGRWLSQAGRKDEAIAVLRAALTKDGAHADAETLLSALLRQTPANAVAAAQADVTRDATPESYLNLSLAYAEARNYPASLDAAREALKLRPDYAEAYNNIAAIYEEVRDWDHAIEAAARAIRIQPDFELARNNLLYSQRQKALHARRP